jgi:hypothetical protein
MDSSVREEPQIMNQISRDQQFARGSWQASDPSRYPTQPHSGDVAPPDVPAKGIGARISVAAGLLFGGFVIAAIALFLPWATVSVDSPLGGNLYTVDASPFKGGWSFLILLVIAGAAWLAWPTVSGSQMSFKRLTGLTAAVGAQIICLLIGIVGYANGVAEKGKAMASFGASTGEELTGLHVSIGFGLVLYAAAVVAITVGAVRVWIRRSRTDKQAI